MLQDSNSITFRNHYSRQRIFSNSGSRIHTLYSAHYDDNGSVVLEESGKENIYDIIQSFKDSCDINILLRRYQNGEVEALSKVQGAYGDFTDMPKTYAELLNRLNDGKVLFESLPVDVRSKFGHNFSEFMSQFGSSEWFEKVGVVRKNEESSLEPLEPVLEKKEDKE